MQLTMNNHACKSVDVEGKRYQADHKGHIKVDDNRHARLIRQSDQARSSSPMSTPPHADGWDCPSCGFGSWFRICGRCGAECVRSGQ
jgi:hypothetical protein